MRAIFFSFFCFSAVTGLAQNLLLNGGFEDENICTEYKINCAPEAWISSRSALYNYIDDPGRCYEGTHCMSIEAGHSTRPFERTFIRSQLLCRLRKGNQYRLELYLRSAHSLLDSIGVYFGPIDPLLERKPIERLAPSLWMADNPINHFAGDSNTWQKATLIYKANGDEQYITIANFSKQDITGPTGIRRQNQFLVFLDNISLVPMDTTETLCSNWQQVKAEIYEQDARHQFLDRIIKLRSGPILEQTQVVSSPPVTITDTLVLPDVLFASGKKELRPVSYDLLDSFCNSMAGRQIDSLVIEGHADNTGTNEFNEQLSTDRALSTAAYMKRCALFLKTRIITRGWGSRKPLVPNNSADNRRRNRRVELLVYFHE